MPDEKKHKLRLATIVYWVLLVYIIAALLWWALSLLNQNQDITTLRKENRELALKDGLSYPVTLHEIEDEERRNRSKYLGEGGTFLLLILVGAVFVYRSVRRQFKMQQQQQNFVMAVTHELKTPIAVSRLNLETIQRHQLDESKKARLLQMTLQETLRLDGLINNILISSQLDSNFYPLSREELNLSDLVKDVSTQFITRYPEKQIRQEIEKEVEFAGDALLLKLLVSNLLENAYKYAPRDTAIDLSLSKNANQIILQVTDFGPGIPASERKRIFQKFYRIGNEEVRKTQGTGLGLYLCKKIVHDHGGTIEVKDNQPGGSTFRIQFGG